MKTSAGLEKRSAAALFAALVFALLLAAPAGAPAAAGSAALFACETPGWFPADLALKDHSVFYYDGYYYLVANLLPGENRFAYARTTDFCQWETLSPVMGARAANAWDHLAVWAPFVYEEDGVYYMYYTGVSGDFAKGILTQSIMLATSQDPADPNSWKSQGMVFQPTHLGTLWSPDAWADCRDPSVIKVGGRYYMYYTAQDASGGIVGLAVSDSPFGEWQDRGQVFAPAPGEMLESPTIVRYNRSYYLFYFNSQQKQAYYRIGRSPTGPWQGPYKLSPGWAHEVWRDQAGQWMTSYLTGYSVTISSLSWDRFFRPPRPLIGENIFHLILPILLNQ